MLAPLICCLLAANPTPSDARPNIVLMMADDQGWGDVGYNGNAVVKTPVLDGMAATALRLDRFYAAAPVCSPTRASVLTGRHPNRMACFSWGHTLRTEEVTIAEVLKTAGYATGHFGKWHLGPVRSDSPISPGQSGFDEWFSSPNFYENSPLMSHNGKVVATEGESSLVTVDAALEFIKHAKQRQQPFLAVIWFGSPHLPHIASEDNLALYPDEPKKFQHYWGEITGIDRAVGKVRQTLRELQIADNTLVWYTSDNGATTPGSTGGLAGKKGNLMEGGIRVPCVIEWPAKIRSPRTSDVPAGTVDIYPTLLDLVGAEPKHQPPLDGVSLKPLLTGEMTTRSKPLGFWVYPANGRPVRSHEILAAMLQEQTGGGDPKNPPGEPVEMDRQTYPADEFPGSAAWVDGDWKLHKNPVKSGGFEWSLYNLASDPAEKQDVAADQPQRVAQLREALEAWQQSVVNSLNQQDY